MIEGTTVGTSTEIYENIAAGSFIARMQTDAAVASFAITSGNTGSVFQIAANGDITTTANTPDYEATTSFTLGIVATDYVGRESQPFTFTVNVLDLDENPPVVTLDTSATNLTQINEFVTTDTRIATFNVVDNDTGGAVATTGIAALTRQYIAYVTIGGIRTDTVLSLAPTADVTLFGDPSRQNFFTVWNYISTTNGQVEIWAREKVALAGGVDVNTDITLTVGVADQAGNYGYANYTITVNDFPDPSIFQPVQLRTPDNTFRIQENTPLAEGQGFLSQYTATGTVPVEFSVSGPDADKVTISSDGQLTLTSPLDYEAQTSHTFTVRATNYLYGSDGEIDQTYFDEEECTLTVINDPTDDPEYIDLSAITNLPSDSAERGAYVPYSGFGFFNNDVYWAGLFQEAEDDWSLLPFRYNRALNTAETEQRPVQLSISRLTRSEGFSVWSLVHNGKLLARYNRDYQGEDALRSWGDLPSLRTAMTISNNPVGYNPDRDAFAKTPQGGVVVDGRVWGRYRQGWFTAAQVWPWRDIEEAVVTTDGGWPTNLHAYSVQVGNYLYAISPDLYTGTRDGLGRGFRSYNEVRVFHAPTRANRNNGLKFAYVGSTTIESWPVPSANDRNTGIAYDGTHIWVGRGSILLKFTAPPASNPTAPLVPAR